MTFGGLNLDDSPDVFTVKSMGWLCAMKKYEFIKQLEEFDNNALVFIDGIHGYGIEEVLGISEKTVSKTGNSYNGDIVRVYEESNDGEKAIYIHT